MAAYYKLVGGTHEEVEGGEKKRYKLGDVVRSSKRLDKTFENKFERASTDEIRTAKKQRIKEQEEERKRAEEDERLEAQAAEEAEVEAEEELEEEERDMKTRARAKAKAKRMQAQETESDLGDNVTKEFKGAGEAGLAVFKNGRTYNVAQADSPNQAVDEGEGLNKKQVRTLIKELASQQEEQEEEEEDDA